MPVLDDDTEVTPPTAAPGAFRFDFDWNDDAAVEAAVGDARSEAGPTTAAGSAVRHLAEEAAITLNDADAASDEVLVDRASPVRVERVPSAAPVATPAPKAAPVRAAEPAAPRAGVSRPASLSADTSAATRTPAVRPAGASMAWLVFGAGGAAVAVCALLWAVGVL